MTNFDLVRIRSPLICTFVNRGFVLAHGKTRPARSCTPAGRVTKSINRPLVIDGYKRADNRRRSRLAVVSSICGDRDTAVDGLELQCGSALANICIDAIAVQSALYRDRKADRDATVDGLCYQVCGVIVRSLY